MRNVLIVALVGPLLASCARAPLTSPQQTNAEARTRPAIAPDAPAGSSRSAWSATSSRLRRRSPDRRDDEAGDRMRRLQRAGRRLHALDRHVVRMKRECFQVIRVRGQHRAARFGGCDHERIDGRSTTRQTSEQSSSPGQSLGHGFGYPAGFQKPILVRVVSGASPQTFDQHNRRDGRGPKFLLPQRYDESERIARPLCQPRDAA